MKRKGINMYDGKNLDFVSVHLFKTSIEEKFISVDKIAIRNSEEIKKNIFPNKYKTLNAALKQLKIKSNISVVITSSKMKDELYKLESCEHYIVHVARSPKEARDLMEEFKFRNTEKETVFTTIEQLSADVNNLLENIAYEPLKTAYKTMTTFLRASQPGQDNEFQKIGREADNYTLNSNDIGQIECLCEEILALYEISNVPKDQRPQGSQNTEISKGMRDDVFKQCQAVDAIGFHFSNLHIYVRGDASEPDRDEEIRKVMKKHNVENYHITLSGSFVELMDTGSTIGAGAKKGSLGCYAEMKNGQTSKTCILLSMHVASECSEICLVNNGPPILIADVIEATTEHEHGSLDIAAAQIKDGVNVERDDRKLKDSEGYRREGKLIGNSEIGRILRKGRKVHIWGSNSKPGFGIIIDTQYFIRGMTVNLIRIQDEDCSSNESRPFAKAGDSGSIVCSDDPCDEHVYALAMLIGTTEGQYLSLPLPDGVKQLEARTNNQFTLF